MTPNTLTQDIILSCHNQSLSIHGPSQIHPDQGISQTALQSLIFWIYANQATLSSSRALEWLRQPFFTSSTLSQEDQALLKVSAKRVKVTESQKILDLRATSQIIQLDHWREYAKEELAFLEKVSEKIWTLSAQDTFLSAHLNSRPSETVCDDLPAILHSILAHPNPLTHQPVAAILVSKEGRVLASGVNTNARIKPMHAEMNLSRHWIESERTTFPKDATVWVTLKPCRMCLAHLKATFGPHPFTVRYLHDDPGPHASEAVLKPLLGEGDLLIQTHFNLSGSMSKS